MPKKWTWDQMIEEFRALGGVADNVIQKKGEYGRVDISHRPVQACDGAGSRKPVCSTSTKITFDNGALRIKKDAAGIGEREKKFFDMFENDLFVGAVRALGLHGIFKGHRAAARKPAQFADQRFWPTKIV